MPDNTIKHAVDATSNSTMKYQDFGSNFFRKVNVSLLTSPTGVSFHPCFSDNERVILNNTTRCNKSKRQVVCGLKHDIYPYLVRFTFYHCRLALQVLLLLLQLHFLHVPMALSCKVLFMGPMQFDPV